MQQPHVSHKRAYFRTSLLDVTFPKVRIEIRVRGKAISTPVSASYGFEEATGDVQLKPAGNDPKLLEPDTVTLMISKEPTPRTTATVHLLDATSGTELARVEQLEIAIAI